MSELREHEVVMIFERCMILANKNNLKIIINDATCSYTIRSKGQDAFSSKDIREIFAWLEGYECNNKPSSQSQFHIREIEGLYRVNPRDLCQHFGLRDDILTACISIDEAAKQIRETPTLSDKNLVVVDYDGKWHAVWIEERKSFFKL